MRPGTDKLLAKAERAAHNAAHALAAGGVELAGGRAFSALLYAAKAVLNERGVRLYTHARIVAALQRVAPREAPRLAEWLAAAIERRRSGDGAELTHEEAARLVERAHEAVATLLAAHAGGLRGE